MFHSEDIGRYILSCEVVQKGGFGAPDLYGRGYSTLWRCVFKSQLLPSMWPILSSV